jgi:uncharacterized protein YndB with AHSA1/START domain
MRDLVVFPRPVDLRQNEVCLRHGWISLMRSAQRGYLQSLRCVATTGQLWQALVQPEALKLWHVDEAEVDPRAGGRYIYRSRLFGIREAHIDIFEPARRLKLVYDPNPRWPAGDSIIVEDFLIDSHDTSGGVSLLRLLGSGVPTAPEWNDTLKRLQAGWAVAFSYLQRRLESRAPERLGS